MRTAALWLLLTICALGQEVTFYVNTASSAGGDGTTNNTSGATRAFASLREAITHSGLDIAEERLIECSGAAADTLNIVQAHWDSLTTTPATRVRIRGNNPTPGLYNTSAYRLEGDGVNILYNNFPPDIEIYSVSFKLINGTGLTACRLSTQNVGAGRTDAFCRISRCVFWLPNGGNATYNSNYADGASPAFGRIVVDNCVSIGGSFGAANTGVENYNNTVHGAVDGFLDPQVIINCVSAGNSGLDYNNVGTGGGLSSHNASEDGTAPTQNSRTGLPAFVDAAGGNLHLASNDTVAKDYGVSDPASGLFSTDIDGQTRTGTWDIGFDEQLTGLTVTALTIGTLTIGQ